MTIRFSKDNTAWQLKESGVLVADSEGFRTTGISLTTDEYSHNISLNTLGKNKNYEFFSITDSWVQLKHVVIQTGSPDGKVVVTSFTPDISSIQFGLPNIELTVPNELPSYITTLSNMFGYSNLFNQDISGWDTSNITSFRGTFTACEIFNQDISGWDTSNVTDMSYLFRFAKAFNQDISSWDVSSVTDMRQMFYYTDKFNQNIIGWDVSSVTDMNNMFGRALLFNQNISGWDVSNVTDMVDMFIGAKAFNQDLSGWCVTKIPSRPTGFDNETTYSWTLPKPVWGTCPRGEDLAV